MSGFKWLPDTPLLATPAEFFGKTDTDAVVRQTRRSRGYALTTLPARLLGALRRWNARRRTSVALRELDDRILADIGLTRADIGQIARGHYVVDHSAAYVTKIPAATLDTRRTGQRAA